MRRTFTSGMLALLVIAIWPSLRLAQAQKPPSLEEQLRAQYEPGTLLTLRKAGILAVAPAQARDTGSALLPRDARTAAATSTPITCAEAHG